MSLKMGLNLTRNYSINFSLPKRKKKFIKFIIIHYTGMKKESDAIKRLCDSNVKVSSHYFIQKKGNIIQLVPDLYTAWHAGKSNWKKFKSLNKYSIGIEINNPGHRNGYTNFSKTQISSLVKLLRFLIKEYKIDIVNILGHSDISPERKKDPGEKFPWSQLAKKKLCFWHTLNEKKIKRFRNKKLTTSESENFIKNLNDIGYPKKITQKNNKNKNYLVKAFQRRYRQNLINGKMDQECLLISENLLNL